MLSHLQYKDKLTILFCLIDDFLKLLPKPLLPLPSSKSTAGRFLKLSIFEALTLALFRFWTTQPNWKTFRYMLASSFQKEFSTLPYYEQLLRQINRYGPLALLLLIALLRRSKGSGTYVLDATALPVSRHGRQAKVMKNLASQGKDGKGKWFFGFKLHAVCDERKGLVKLRITPR